MKNKTLVTPAPTAASVIAKSGACNNTQITDMTTEYELKIIIDVNKFLLNPAAIAQTTKKTNKIISNISISCHLLPYLLLFH